MDFIKVIKKKKTKNITFEFIDGILTLNDIELLLK